MSSPLDPDTILRLRIELRDIRPKIFRTVDVEAGTTLLDLHYVIQDAFDWDDDHFWQFRIAGVGYSAPDPLDVIRPESVDLDTVTLEQVFNSGAKKFLYIYDFGDYWVHDIRFNKPHAPRPGVAYPVLVKGQRRTPPEDIGGRFGYYDFLDAISDVNKEKNLENYPWEGPFDPEEMVTKLRRLEDFPED